jgi:hypothetical protein
MGGNLNRSRKGVFVGASVTTVDLHYGRPRPGLMSNTSGQATALSPPRSMGASVRSDPWVSVGMVLRGAPGRFPARARSPIVARMGSGI